MGRSIKPPENALLTEIRDLRRRLARLERMPSGTNSIGIQFLRPAVKAGTPSDGDYATPPPAGTIVIDTSGSRIWVRTAAGTWKSVVIA